MTLLFLFCTYFPYRAKSEGIAKVQRRYSEGTSKCLFLISLCLFLISLDTFLLSILLYYTPFMVNNKGKVWRNGKKVVSLHEKLQV